MNSPMNINKPNDITKLLDKFNTMGFLLGLSGFWVTDINYSSKIINIYNKAKYVIEILNLFFAISILGSFFTQKNLTDKQATDRIMFGITLPGNMIFYYILLYYKKEVRVILYHLAVVLKEHHNDDSLEREMLKKLRVFSIILFVIVTPVCVTYGVIALYRVLAAGENFVILIPAWPDVHDNSSLANVVNVFLYIWWLTAVAPRTLTTFLFIVTIMTAMCYQFRNLQSYFYSLDDIFSNNTLSQVQKETKYEQAFKIGIQMHSLTLWCKKQHQHVSKEIFAIETILFFVMLLIQLTTLLGGEHNLTQLLITCLFCLAFCLVLGFFMWIGGDITIEASKLSEAMYSSGWHNCYGQSSVRIRKLVVNAMRQAQEPVVYKTFGVMELSYDSYVTLVKLPYTALSVFY